MAIDVMAALGGISDASTAVLAVLGAFVALQAAVFGLKRVHSLIAGPGDVSWGDGDFGPPDDFLDTVPMSSDGLEPNYVSESEYYRDYPDSPEFSSSEFAPEIDVHGNEVSDVDPGSFVVTCAECGWDGVASDAVADNDWFCPACGSSQLE